MRCPCPHHVGSSFQIQGERFPVAADDNDVLTLGPFSKQLLKSISSLAGLPSLQPEWSFSKLCLSGHVTSLLKTLK